MNTTDKPKTATAAPEAPTRELGCKAISEYYNHDVCPECGTASVPVEGVPDQAFRGCPECSHTWSEDLTKAPTINAERLLTKQVVPDPVPSVLNQWTLDPEIYPGPFGSKHRSNAVTSGGKLVGKLVGFSESQMELIVASVNHAEQLAVQLGRLERLARDTIGADGALILGCDNAREALAAYEKDSQ